MPAAWLSLLLAVPLPRAASTFTPYGYQSGHVAGGTDGTAAGAAQATAAALLDSDIYVTALAYYALHGLAYFGGVTYSTCFNSVTDLRGDVRGAMDMSVAEGWRDARRPHLPSRDCFPEPVNRFL